MLPLKDRLLLYVDQPRRHLDFQKAFAADHSVRCVANGREALDVLARTPAMAVVTAHNLRDMSGIELCDRVRRRFPGTIRVLLTTPGGKAHALDALNAQTVRRFLVEPWDADVLRQVLRDQVRAVRREQRIRRLKAKVAEQRPTDDLAVTRACLLNDLSRTSRTVANCCGTFELLLDSLNGVVDDDVYGELSGEFDKLQAVTSYLTDLHTKTDLRFKQRPLSDEVYRLADLIGATVALVQLDTVVGPRLAVDCPSDLLVDIDRTDLSRIVMNLILNALQAFESAGLDHGRIEIRATGEDDRAVIAVDDNGPGIPDELTSQIFEPFYTTKDDPEHTGLGLTICKELATAHGGEVEVVTNDRGDGTTVYVRIPLAQPGMRT
jgi:signal transduction histidine kinase